jgi:hypothetical protein
MKKRLLQKCTLSCYALSPLQREGRKGSYQNVCYYAEPFHHYEDKEEKAATKMYNFILRLFYHYNENEKCSNQSSYFYAKPFHHFEEKEEKTGTKMNIFLPSLFFITKRMKKRLLSKIFTFMLSLFIIMIKLKKDVTKM